MTSLSNDPFEKRFNLLTVYDFLDVVGGEDADAVVELTPPPGLLVLRDQVDDVAHL